MADLSDDTYEILDVPIQPVATPSQVGTPEFEENLIGAFLECLKAGRKLVPSYNIAKWMKIDRHELENFLDKDDRFYSIKGKDDQENVYCYGYKNPTDKQKIGTIDWEFQLVYFLLADEKKTWKSPEYLAQKLECEISPFKEWMENCSYILRKNSKEKGKFYYGLESRYKINNNKKEEKKEEKKETKKIIPPSVSNRELFAYAMLRNNCDQLIKEMNYYANLLATRHKEAHGYLTQAQASFMAAISILTMELKVDDHDLPDMNNI